METEEFEVYARYDETEESVGSVDLRVDGDNVQHPECLEIDGVYYYPQL